MWSPLLEPRLTLISGSRRELRDFHQELAHFAIHEHAGTVLWCDGDHGMDPYAMAELNMVRGYEADFGADRVLIKRCMTPFQWDTTLTKHLGEKLVAVDAALVLVAPFDRLFSTDELADWEQEDYVHYCLAHLTGLVAKHGVPVVLSVDMPRWWVSHPLLAQMTYEAAAARWTVMCPEGRWRAVRDDTGEVVDPWLRRQVTLLDWVLEEEPLKAASHPHGLPPMAMIPRRRKAWGDPRRQDHKGSRT